jgi:hypothetical protein
MDISFKSKTDEHAVYPGRLCGHSSLSTDQATDVAQRFFFTVPLLVLAVDGLVDKSFIVVNSP